MDKLTNREIIQLGAAVNRVIVYRLYSNGMTDTKDLSKFTGLSEKMVEKIMKEFNPN